MQDKWVNIAPRVALEVLGEPKTKTDKEWRWGTKGSFVFNVQAGTFFDFENDEGGGVAWLLETNNIDKAILTKFDQGFASNGTMCPACSNSIHVSLDVESSKDTLFIRPTVA